MDILLYYWSANQNYNICFQGMMNKYQGNGSQGVSLVPVVLEMLLQSGHGYL